MEIFIGPKVEADRKEREMKERELRRQQRRARWDISSLGDDYVELPKDPERWKKRISRLRRFWAQLRANRRSPAYIALQTLGFIAFMGASTVYTYFSILKVLMEGWPVLWLLAFGLAVGLDLAQVTYYQSHSQNWILRHLIMTFLFTVLLAFGQLALALLWIL